MRLSVTKSVISPLQMQSLLLAKRKTCHIVGGGHFSGMSNSPAQCPLLCWMHIWQYNRFILLVRVVAERSEFSAHVLRDIRWV